MVLSGAPVTKKKRAVTPCVAPSTLPLPRGGGGEHGQVESGAAGEFQRHDFVSNVVKTTKYNVLTFLPKNLFEQFSKAANMYFLVILILQYIEIIAPWAPTMAYLPLAVVVSALALKAAVEDYFRFLADRDMNRSPVLVLDAHDAFVELEWSQLKVGDIVRVPKNAPFPADLLLLSSSHHGFKCFVETKSLDGETNLKTKTGMPELSNLTSIAALAGANLVAHCEGPQGDIYSFVGSVTIDDAATGTRIQRPLSIDQVLLRGTVLKNTETIIGMVLYTSTDTKIIINAGQTPTKVSSMDKVINQQVFAIVGALLVVCIGCSVANYIWQSQAPADAIWMTEPVISLAFNAFLSFWTFLILLSNFMSISIYVSFEIVKLVQALFINMDEEMYDSETNFYCLPRNWNISDELGQVEYLFSDKTGTLTENSMEFRSCYVAGKTYRNNTPKLKTTDSVAMRTLRKVYGASVSPELPEHYLYDTDLVADVVKATGESDLLNSRLLRFGEAMSLCHSVQIDEQSLVYASPSPDELALLNFVRDLGFVFHGRGQSTITVSIPGEKPAAYTVVAELAFTSERRRMSVIVRRPNGTYLLVTKGADSVMLDRFENKDLVEIDRVVETFAKEGLRTLCYGYREFSDVEFEAWMDRYRVAELGMENRAANTEVLADEIEQKLSFLGVTALEDRLQERVPETIRLLRQAGIKIWMLTGDKLETAVSIGLSCKLITPESKRNYITGATVAQVEQELDAAHSDLIASGQTVLDPAASKFLLWRLRQFIFPDAPTPVKTKLHPPACIIVQGESIAVIMDNPELKKKFAAIGTMVMSAICCRVAPKQKSMIVAAMQKQLPDAVTLAIGDGANDVSMLQTAHVGVGIFGKEGRQAVNASDYAFSRFAFLQRLVLVHGHWNYVRTAHLALMIYYKNMVYSLPLLWFQYLAGYTGSTLYQYTYNMLYNLIFTSLPPIVAAAYNQDIPAKAILAHPELFYGGINHKHFNFRIWLFHLAIAVYQSIVIFLIAILAYTCNEASTVWSGFSGDYLFEIGTLMYLAVVLNVNIYVALTTRTWPWFFQLTVHLSTLSFLPFLAIIAYQFTPESGVPVFLYKVVGDFFSVPAFWFSLLLTIPVCQGLPLVLRYIRGQFFPTDADIMREYYRDFDERRQSLSGSSNSDRAHDLWRIWTRTMSPHGKQGNGSQYPSVVVPPADKANHDQTPELQTLELSELTGGSSNNEDISVSSSRN